MRLRRSVLAAVLSSVAVVGCSSMTDQPAPQQTPIDNTGTSAARRPGTITVDATTVTARVSAVDTTAMLAALRVYTGNLNVGDAIVFTDANQTGVANGVVTSIENNGTIPQVKYTVGPGGRSPVVNDLAFHIAH